MTRLTAALGGSIVAALAGLAVALAGPGTMKANSSLAAPSVATTTVAAAGTTPTSTTPTTTADAADISGPCDEPEHRNDPRCSGIAPTTATVPGERREPGEDVRGPCDEPEHRNDPRCTGAAPTGSSGPGPGARDRRADGDDRSGRRSGRGDRDDDRSGRRSGGDDDRRDARDEHDDRRGSNSGRG